MENNKIAILRKENALRKFPHSGVFLVEMNADVCRLKFSRCITAIDCLNSKSATLSELNEWYGSDTPIDWVSIQIATLNLFVNVSNSLNPDQIKEISYWIYERYSKLNLADITLIISRIKLGEYGKLYNNLSGEFILNCFSDYVKARRREIRNLEIQKGYAYDSIQEFGMAFIKNIDKLPHVSAILNKDKKE